MAKLSFVSHCNGRRTGKTEHATRKVVLVRSSAGGIPKDKFGEHFSPLAPLALQDKASSLCVIVPPGKAQ